MSNALVLLAIGTLYLLYGARPDGLIVGGVLAALSACLFGCVRFTDPYRGPGRRGRARRGR